MRADANIQAESVEALRDCLFFFINFNTIIAISGYLCAHLCIVVTVTFILIHIFEKE